MRILITGSNGLLGSEFVNYCVKNDLNFKTISYSELCGEYGYLKFIFEDFQPNLVLHCAANTDVEWCESNELDCYRDNVLITEKLSNLSQSFNSKFVFFSSTGIYGNKKKDPYTEFISPCPTTVHHTSKYIAEQKVQSLVPNHLILRVGWLFGGNPDSKKNFVINRINDFHNSEGDVSANSDQYGSPTYVLDVVDVTFRLIKISASGIFNCVNLGVASRFDYVNEIGKIINFRHTVKPVSASSFSRVAKVSNNEMAVNEKLNSYGVQLNTTWKVRLREYIESVCK
ncbi:sugar nucleotide-binding protein [Vibrio coralliilyticus]|uniref:SDR family oxidoreductase n=1 Tax=Vibrio coralliilyticus TaxID=190893 RepID=UPI00069887CF|nr:sugar nucleotide-binding protein [Vibrio coralliilyticus]QOU29789.1 sugar nucleotide-binding protein [Vibrio coralliilyticus]